MPVETSFYQQPAPDPMKAVAGTVGVANALAQNRALNTQANMLQSQYGAAQAIGNAFQQSIDPTTGMPDTAAVGRAIQSSPDAAYGAQTGLQSNANLRGTMLANQGTAAQNATNYAVNFAAAINALPDTATADDIRAATDQLNAEGRIDPGYAAAIHADPALTKQSALRYIQTKALGVVPVDAQLATVPGEPNPKTLQPTITTNAAMVKGINAAPGAVSTSPSPQAQASLNEYVGDLKTSYNIAQSVIPLRNALPLIQQLSTANFGPGSPQFSTIRSGLIQAGVLPANSNAADQEAMLEEANKYLEQNVIGAPGAGRSDAALNEIMKSNPRTGLVQPAALGLIKNQIGRQVFNAYLPKIYDQSPDATEKGAPGYLDFKPTATDKYDYRAFNWNDYSDDDKRKILAELGGPNSPGALKFKKSFQAAVKVGAQSPIIAPASAALPQQGAP